MHCGVLSNSFQLYPVSCGVIIGKVLYWLQRFISLGSQEIKWRSQRLSIPFATYLEPVGFEFACKMWTFPCRWCWHPENTMHFTVMCMQNPDSKVLEVDRKWTAFRTVLHVSNNFSGHDVYNRKRIFTTATSKWGSVKPGHSSTPSCHPAQCSDRRRSTRPVSGNIATTRQRWSTYPVGRAGRDWEPVGGTTPHQHTYTT